MNTLKRLLATTALVGAVAAPTAASAANVAAVPLKCGTVSNCYILTVDGKIMPDDDKKFEAVINKNDVRVAVVALNSPGGNLLSGLSRHVIGPSLLRSATRRAPPSNGITLSRTSPVGTGQPWRAVVVMPRWCRSPRCRLIGT